MKNQKTIKTAFSILAFSLLQLGTSLEAKASTDEKINIPEMQLLDFSPASTLTPKEAFIRSQAVLEHFGIGNEVGDEQFLEPMGSHFSDEEMVQRLKWFDPMNTFTKFYNFIGQKLLVYQDMGAKNVLDLEFDLNQADSHPGLRERILAAQKNPDAQILHGLRIALDPGHMGGDIWDERTGKFVKEGANKVSEGVINLQVCLLLKSQLESLGAQVLMTRDKLTAISQLDYNTFDLHPWGLKELRYTSLSPWFQNLLSAAPAGPQLFAAFEQNASFKSLFAEKTRWQYFVKRADLDARSEMMQKFSPDITIYVHHDTSTDTGTDVKAPNAARAFIPGAFQAVEFSDRASRRFFTRALADQDSWELSVQMIRKALGRINQNMGIPPAKVDGTESVKVEDGIFARNLQVPRKMKNTITAYFELFYYNKKSEFDALLNAKNPMMIDGKNVPYSDRVAQSATSLREGIVDFVKTAK